jgi:cell division septation protein DedD
MFPMGEFLLELWSFMKERKFGLRSLWRSWMTPSARAFHSQVTLTREEYHQKHVPGETKARVMTPFIDLLAGAICSVLLLVAFFAMLPYLQSPASMVLLHISSVMHRTTSAEVHARVRSLKSTRETDITGERSTADNGPSGLENDRDTQQQSEKEIDQFAAESSTYAAITPPENSISDTVKAAPMDIEEREKNSNSRASNKTGKQWSVQLMATPDQGVATVWWEKLNAKGYDAFVVEAEIDGKTWYRVRLGIFTTLRDAETLSAQVRLKEGFHDAFVAASTQSEIIALERVR